MNDLEKVIYSIERCICHVPDACRDCAYDAGHPYNECVEMMLKDAISMLKAQEPGWISVKDRLPDSNRFVLVCNDDGHMMIAQYIEETAQWQYKYINYDVDVWDDEEQGPVCYWAYLPEPPKEG